MTKNLELSLAINVDKKEGESNLNAFQRAFKDALRNIGKSADETQALKKTFDDIARGKVQVEELDTQTQQLYQTYKEGATVASDRDFLGLKAHVDVQKEIEATREAYKRLKDSGELTQEELAQAALKTEDRIRELNKQTNGWADSLMSAKGSMLALAGSVGGMAKIVGTAIDFESAMSDVKKVVDGTDDQIQQLTTRIKEMTGELPITAEGLAAIAAAGGQLGVPIEKLDQFIALAAKMSTAFNLSVDEAGEAVAKLSNVFNIPIENVEALGDAINTLGNTTAAREKDILDVLTRVGGTANQFKLTAEQTSALAATMLEMGTTSEVASTAINAMLSRLQTASVQSPQFQQALESMGISATKLADDIRENPQEALLEFLRTLEELDDKSRAEALVQLFGREYQSKVALLLGGLDRYEASLDRISDKTKVAGAMQREFEERMSTTETQLQLMKNGLNNIAINLGSIFLPALRESAIFLGDVTHAIASFVEAHPGVAKIATTLTLVAASASALRLVLLSLGSVGAKAFASIRTEVALTKLSMADLNKQVGFLGAAIRTVGGVWAAWEIGSDIGDALYDNFEIARRAGNRLAQAFTLLMESAAAAWKVLKNPGNISQIWDEYTESVKQVNQIYGEMADDIGTANETIKGGSKDAAGAIDDLGSATDGAAKKAGELQDAFNNIDLASSTGVLEYTKLIDQAAGNTSELKKQLDEWIKNANALDLSAFQNNLNEALSAGKISTEDFAKHTMAVLDKAFADVGVNAKSALGALSDEAQNAIGHIDLIATTLKSAGATGEQAMLALEQAINGAIGKVDNAAAVAMLKNRIQELGAAGTLSADQVERLTRKLQEQTEVIHGATPGIQSIEEAFKKLGLTSQQELERMANEAREAFNKVGALGGSLEQQQVAFESYAKTATEALKGMSDEQQQAVVNQLRVTAATLGMQQQLEELIGVQQQVGGAGADMGTEIRRGTEAGTQGMNTLKQASEETGKVAGGVGAALAAIFNATRQNLLDLSEAAAALFDKRMGINTSGPVTEMEALKASIDATNAALGETRHRSAASFDVTGIGRYLNKMNEASQATRLQFQQQQLEAMKLTQALTSTSNVTASTITQAQVALSRLKLLGSEDLNGLRSALDSANSKLLAMNENAKSTLQNLQNELDRLQDNQAAIDNRDYQNKRAQLQSALQEAQQMRNQEAVKYYTDALKVLDQVRAEKSKQLAADKAEKAQREREAKQSAQSAQPSKNVNINLGSGNKKASLSASNQSDIDALLDVLQQAGLNAI